MSEKVSTKNENKGDCGGDGVLYKEDSASRQTEVTPNDAD